MRLWAILAVLLVLGCGRSPDNPKPDTEEAYARALQVLTEEQQEYERLTALLDAAVKEQEEHWEDWRSQVYAKAFKPLEGESLATQDELDKAKKREAELVERGDPLLESLRKRVALLDTKVQEQGKRLDKARTARDTADTARKVTNSLFRHP